MVLFNLSLPEGVYIVGAWNNWVPTDNDKMSLDGGIYKITIPATALEYQDGSEGKVGWYKVIYVSTTKTVVSSSLPITTYSLGSDTQITIYATPTLMKDGFAIGVGDSVKEKGDWYLASEINNWQHEKMTKEGEVFVLEKEDYTINKDKITFKIARKTDWKPYEEQFDGKNYNAGMGQDASYKFKNEIGKTVNLRFIYNPKFSTLTVEESVVGE